MCIDLDATDHTARCGIAETGDVNVPMCPVEKANINVANSGKCLFIFSLAIHFYSLSYLITDHVDLTYHLDLVTLQLEAGDVAPVSPKQMS